MKESSIAKYWSLRLEACRKVLERNNFDAFLVEDPDAARRLVLERIVPETGAQSLSWGDSETLDRTGLLDSIRQDPSLRLIETFDSRIPREEIIERRRQALLVDLFLTGTNALTESGTLVNLDMVGNRVGGIVFGPKNVVVLVGRNKIVADLDQAMKRVRGVAAPANVIRHPGLKTPCASTAFCADCRSLDRICNTWVITEKSYPKGRIKVVLINGDYGL